MKEFLAIKQEAKAEIIEKRSKFIAEVFYVESIKEAEDLIAKVKKREHNAKHHCYAYRVIGETIVERMSDDGEPSGTAGAPILSMLQSKKLYNVLVIVTRHFGGILLGTGGLVRAYTEAATNAIEKSGTKKMQKGVEIELEINYQDYENLKYYLNKINGKIILSEYKNNIKIIIQIPNFYIDNFILNYQNLPFKIEKSKKGKEKYVDI